MTLLIRRLLSSSAFVPSHPPVDFRDVYELQLMLNHLEKLLVITGAGVSTESGIPDYRSDKVGRFATSKHKPIEYKDFMNHEKIRRRYWARNFIAWPKFSSYPPNATHNALAYWENGGRLLWNITQNVDDLHKKAGSVKLTELHGSGSRVKCVKCGFVEQRNAFQQRMRKSNPHFNLEAVSVAPDGDVDIDDSLVEQFSTPTCLRCREGFIRPDIVFFGDNVAAEVVEFCYDKVDTADGLLILGSSLQVYSSFRFVKRFSERAKPIFIINIGQTRADSLAKVKISAKCGDIVPLLKVSREEFVPLPFKHNDRLEPHL